MTADDTLHAPMIAPTIRVNPAWIDQNSHMNMAYYLLVFDLAIDHIWSEIGLGVRYLEKSNASTFTLQTQIQYAQEVLVDDPLRVEFQLVAFDAKRIHCFQRMYHAEKDYLAATEERITVHVDMEQRKSAPFPADISSRLQRLLDLHKSLPKDNRIGRRLTLDK